VQESVAFFGGGERCRCVGAGRGAMAMKMVQFANRLVIGGKVSVRPSDLPHM